METWEVKRLHFIPVIMILWVLSGMLICFLVALREGHVSAYVPFISEAGGKLPESGIFGIFLAFGAILGIITIIIQYFIIFKYNYQYSKKIDILNKIALFVGSISFFGMIIVGAYSMYGILNAHLIGARIVFYGALIYGFLQMLISFFLWPRVYRIPIFQIRFFICILALIFQIGMIIMFPLGISQWNSSHSPAEKVPGDHGFAFILASSACEWLMVILFLCFLLTFAKDFKMISLKISILSNDQNDRNSETTRLIS
ncbi:DNA damage-regulated autophagy modulator protein 1-like [Centruroides vittatus]|uniref:DNA damage-regulated autophagy modulator protein 1-like n=1 Tax=Centruroides vittatus TaxID=120091 RepID=UPI00350FA219